VSDAGIVTVQISYFAASARPINDTAGGSQCRDRKLRLKPFLKERKVRGLQAFDALPESAKADFPQ
jgi:hypothetical protein